MNLKQTILIFLLASASIAYASTTITFDDLIGDGTVPTDYMGLTWSSGWNHYGWDQPPYDASSPEQRVYVYDNLQTIDFGQAVTFEGSWFAGYDYSAPFWTGYDQFNNVIYTSTPGLGYQNLNWSGVWKVGVEGAVPDYYIVDDIKYSASVPDAASTSLLLGLGLLGLGFLRRKLS
jgi:hypothetical protein